MCVYTTKTGGQGGIQHNNAGLETAGLPIAEFPMSIHGFLFFLWSISFIFEGNNLVQCKSIISILLAKIVLSKSQIHTCNAKHTKVEQFQVITNRTNFISFYQWMLIFISLFLILNIGSTVGLRCGQKSYDHKVSKLLKKQ